MCEATAVTVFGSILRIVSLIIIVASLVMLFRNNAVASFRRDLLQQIRPGDPKFYEKMGYLLSVSYDEMVYKFWKPLKSFYDMEKFK